MYGEFVWFVGVVEDRMDPELMNRVKVRCFGYHTEDRKQLPTEDLPWATPMMPVTSASNSGIHESPHGMIESSLVVGFFRDGHDAQDPVIMGTIASRFDEKPDPEKGFSDPNDVYPRDEDPYKYVGVGTSDVNEHAANRRGEQRETPSKLVEDKRNSITQGIKTAAGGTWSEPETPYAPKYPFNHVKESESGHLQEIDDTDGAERLHEYHKAGTFREVHPDGSIVTRIVSDKYEIVAGDEYVNVKGNVKLTIDANCETYIKGNWDIKVDGNITQTVGLNVTQIVGGNVTETVTGNVTETVEGDVTETFKRTQTTKVSGVIDIDGAEIYLN